MKNNNWFIIEDIETLINTSRAVVFNSFGKTRTDTSNDNHLDKVLDSDKEELDKILSYDESLLIAQGMFKKQKHKKTKEERYVISDIIYHKYISSLNERMIGNILNSLVNKGLVEAAFDSESNDFVFWIKDEAKEKPETD